MRCADNVFVAHTKVAAACWWLTHQRLTRESLMRYSVSLASRCMDFSYIDSVLTEKKRTNARREIRRWLRSPSPTTGFLTFCQDQPWGKRGPQERDGHGPSAPAEMLLACGLGLLRSRRRKERQNEGPLPRLVSLTNFESMALFSLPKNQKVFKILSHIKYFVICMKH
jgi:hypothetical protein